MFKKLVSIMMILSLVCTCLGTIAFASESTELDYEPTDFTFSSAGSASAGFKLAWKNPVKETLSKVTVYSIDEDDATYVVNSPVPGEISSVNVLAGKDYGYYTFKLIYEFTDGTVKEVYYSMREVHDNAQSFSSKAGITFYHKNGSGCRTKANAYVVNSENSTTDGSKALMVISNRQGNSSGVTDENNNRYLLKFDGSMYTKMVADAEYKLTMKVKSDKDAVFELRAGDNADWIVDVNVSASEEWQTYEKTFKGKAASKGGLVLSFIGLPCPLYIDDIKLVKTSDNTVVADQNFEVVTSTYSAPDNIVAEGGDKSVTFTWTAPTGDTRFINIYEKLSDGTLVLRAKTKHTDTGVTLSNLKAGKQYTFVVTGSALIGLETNKDENVFRVSTIAEAIVRNPKLDYEPTDITFSSAGSISAGFKLAWKNPIKDTLSKVTVYSVDEDNATYVVNNPVPGAISSVNVLAGKDYGYYSFKLVYEFTDGTVKEVYCTLRSVHDNAASFSSAAGITFYHKNGTGCRTKANGYVVNSENATANGEKSLMIISNMQGNSTGVTDENNNRYLLKFDGSMYTKMIAGEEYRLTMKVKTEKDSVFELRAGDNAEWIGDMNVPAGNDWQIIEKTFSGKAASKGGLVLSFVGLPCPLYIDDIKLVKTDDNTIVTDQDFEIVSSSYSAPSNISATGGDKSVTFTWTAPNNDTRYINVYEKLDDGTLILRARTKHTDKGITISNLDAGEEYTFVVTGSALIGLESDKSANEITVSTNEPIVLPYEVNELKLLSGADEAGRLADGTYSAKAVLLNNKMGIDFTAQIIVAVYDGNELLDCYVSPITNVQQNSVPVTLNVDEFSVADTANRESVVKVMLWTGLGNVVPLCESVSYTE